MTWHVTGAVTEVGLTFTALAPALTRVAVEHRGWEALSDAQLAAACALPGGYSGGALDRAWVAILGRFAAALTPDRHHPSPDATPTREETIS